MPQRIFQNNKNSNRKDSIKNEKGLAEKLNIKLVKNSGAGIQKGDLKTNKLMLELKQTSKNSISIKKEWLDKLFKEATTEGKEPVLIIDIQGIKLFCIQEHVFNKVLTDVKHI